MPIALVTAPVNVAPDKSMPCATPLPATVSQTVAAASAATGKSFTVKVTKASFGHDVVLSRIRATYTFPVVIPF